MPDFKTMLLIIALGGGGPLLTYLGVAAPAQQTTADTQAAAEILGTELSACLIELKNCYRGCVPK